MAKEKYNATPEQISFYEDDVSVEESPQGMQVSDSSFSFYEDPNAAVQSLPENLPWYQSYPAAAVKSVINGLVNFGQSFGPVREDPYAKIQEYLKQNQETGVSYNDYTQQSKQQPLDEVLNEYLPSNEGFVENSFKRAGNSLPFLLTGNPATGGSSLTGATTRSLLGGLSAETAKNYGFPEWAQSLAEIPSQVGPSFRSFLTPNKSQAKLVAEGRKLGLTDSEITPLVQNPTKANALGLFAEKRLKTPTTLKNSYDAVNRTYNALSDRPEAKKALNTFQFQRLSTDIQEKLKDMPAGVREIITTDLQDLLNSNQSGSAIINFYRDINHYISNPDLKATQLGILKGPITTALSQLSPELARDFNTANKLYSGYKNIASKLNPNTSSDMLQAGKVGFLMHGIATGNFPEIASVIGSQAAAMMVSELLLNPRFQNYSAQMVNALNKNQISVQKKVIESMVQMAREKNPELAVYLQQLIPLSIPSSSLEIKESTEEEIR